MTTSSSSAAHYLARALSPSLFHRGINANRLSAIWFSSNSACGKMIDRSLVIAAAGAKKKKRDKPDTHSFTVKPEESGPFPEAVLLKQRVVKEDGREEPEFADADEEKLFEFLSLQLESSMNLERMRHYEVVYLIHEDCVEEVDSVVSKVQDFIKEKKGRIYRLNNWGLRRLAYKIKKANKANYILMNFELEARCINEFKAMLDQDERIIRHLVIKRDEAITDDCPPPPEFYTLKAGMNDEEEGEEEEEEEGDGELEEGEWEDDEEGDNIILVGEEEEEEEDDDDIRSARSSKMEKMARR